MNTDVITRERPESYHRRILLAVTGLSPQIVTETLYALTQERTPPFVPTEVHLITTAEGADHARLMLLDPEDGRFLQFIHEYNLEAVGICFQPDHIHTVHGLDGAPLADITSESDNIAVADSITEHVRRFTVDEGSALHASIAGGRKTMGFYLGYALSLYGRAQDRLSHVLVSAPFEADHQFYYPPARPKRLVIKDRPVHTSDARIMLADIPFVRMRHGLSEKLRNGKGSFVEAVREAQVTLGPPELIVDLAGRRVSAAGKIVNLPPAELALLAVFARRAMKGESALAAPNKLVKETEWADRYLAELRIITGGWGGFANAEKALKEGMDGEYFSPLKSDLHRSLKKALGPAALSYLIDEGVARPRRYRLALPPDAIRFEPVQADAAASLQPRHFTLVERNNGRRRNP